MFKPASSKVLFCLTLKSPEGIFRSQLSPSMPTCKAHNCSCHCCCPAELVDPHLDLLGWTATGEAGALRGSCVPALLVPEPVCLHWLPAGDGQAVSLGSLSTPPSVWETDWTSPLVFLIQTESPNMPFTDWVTFPAALTLVFTFLNKTLNLFYCLLRSRKKHLWLLHTYFKRQSLPFT